MQAQNCCGPPPKLLAPKAARLGKTRIELPFRTRRKVSEVKRAGSQGVNQARFWVLPARDAVPGPGTQSEPLCALAAEGTVNLFCLRSLCVQKPGKRASHDGSRGLLPPSGSRGNGFI